VGWDKVVGNVACFEYVYRFWLVNQPICKIVPGIT
jgi:hypothetical protein